MGYRVSIDHDLCASSLLCTRIAPTVFRADADGITQVIEERPADELRAYVEEALQRCPLQAIDIETTPDGGRD